MKNIVFLISFVLLLKPVFPVVEYVANYGYISKVLCVNKTKPEKHCNGKCHLMKELAGSADGEKPAAPEKKNASNDAELFFCEPFLAFEFHAVIGDSNSKSITAYPNFKLAAFHLMLLRPPITLS